MHQLYFVTAMIQGKPTGTFLLADSNDDAAAKASEHLAGGKLTHLVPLCEARHGTLKRNGLLAYCPPSDQISFAQKSLLDIIDVQLKQNAMLRETVFHLMTVVKERMGFKQFKFTVIEGQTGIVQIHEFLASDLDTARQQAEQFAQEHYHPDSKVVSIQEVNP